MFDLFEFACFGGLRLTANCGFGSIVAGFWYVGVACFSYD